MNDLPRPAPGAHTRGFTQPVFISRHSHRGRRVRSVSRGLALLAAAWTAAVLVGSMAVLLTRDTRATFIDLPPHRLECPGSYPAATWRLGARGVTGTRWTLSLYSDRVLAGAQGAVSCRSAAALLPALTAGRQ
ncbi:MAG TPA: hypothetical protein VGN69_06125, partial [Solirubrobacteraceae bacterium]|nr:hypothetical protein [Solirubrobacteraceae bacterium]